MDGQQQRQDDEEREMRALQALMDVAAAGLHEQADVLAIEAGLWARWQQPIKAKREFEARQDGLPF